MIDLTFWSHSLTTDDNTFDKIQVRKVFAVHVELYPYFLSLMCLCLDTTKRSILFVQTLF